MQSAFKHVFRCQSMRINRTYAMTSVGWWIMKKQTWTEVRARWRWSTRPVLCVFHACSLHNGDSGVSSSISIAKCCTRLQCQVKHHETNLFQKVKTPPQLHNDFNKHSEVSNNRGVAREGHVHFYRINVKFINLLQHNLSASRQKWKPFYQSANNLLKHVQYNLII